MIHTLLCVGYNSQGELLLLVFDMNDNFPYMRLHIKSRNQLRSLTRFLDKSSHGKFNAVIDSNKPAISIKVEKKCWDWINTGGLSLNF